MIDTIMANWVEIGIPAAIFVASLIATLWVRSRAYQLLKGRLERARSQAGTVLFPALRLPSLLWCLFVSAYLGLAASTLPADWKDPSGKGLWSFFVLSVAISLSNMVSGLIQLYGPKLQMPAYALAVTKNVVRAVIMVFSVLAILDLWGVPIGVLLLLIVLIIVASVVAFRDTGPNLFAGLQLTATQQIKLGDYIKLESGEEGYVAGIGRTSTRIAPPTGSVVVIPNARLVQRTVVNYGRPLKTAKEAFRFNTRTHLRELTGLKAMNLREMADILKTAPDAVVDYHTHRFLEEHHYLTPEPSNDFAVWVADALGDEGLGERLAAVDTFGFTNLEGLRERLVNTMEEHLAATPIPREAMPGREFYFIRSISAVFPTPYRAHDLREFVEALRKISAGSLFFHVFLSRLRLGTGRNDFSAWLENSLDEKDLAEEIARLDPYTYTLEGLRSQLIQVIEKRIK